MRLLLIACLLLASCAPPHGHSSADSRFGDTMNGTGEPFPEEQVRTSWNQEGGNFPPQCNPEPWFPEGKVPVDFRFTYDKPETKRFYECLEADAKANAKGRDVLFYMPESTLKTECSAADQYPDGQVQPSFYQRLPPDYERGSPENDRYIECVIAEARRDGDRVRLAGPGSFPKVGTCYSSRVRWKGSRFWEGDPHPSGGGTSIGFDNGLNLVDYSYLGQVRRSRLGDPVRICVHDLPKDCPAYDLRGIGYKVRNLRTRETFVMGDSQHICRGA